MSNLAHLHSLTLATQTDKQALLCQIFTLDTVLLSKGNVLIIVLSHISGNGYPTANAVLNVHANLKVFKRASVYPDAACELRIVLAVSA